MASSSLPRLELDILTPEVQNLNRALVKVPRAFDRVCREDLTDLIQLLCREFDVATSEILQSASRVSNGLERQSINGAK